MNSKDAIKIILAHNVPLYITHIKNRGGVSNEEFTWLQCQEDNADYPLAVLMRADEYLLYPKDEKKFLKGMFVLVLTLAIMSFFPGGVRMFGLRFSTELEKYCEVES